MGAEVGCLEPDVLGVGLDDLVNALISEPLGAEPAALGDGAELRSLADAGGQQSRLDRLHGAGRDAARDGDRHAVGFMPLPVGRGVLVACKIGLRLLPWRWPSVLALVTSGADTRVFHPRPISARLPAVLKAD
jgi:hypothetical protein